jgi:hypothetical protein
VGIDPSELKNYKDLFYPLQSTIYVSDSNSSDSNTCGAENKTCQTLLYAYANRTSNYNALIWIKTSLTDGTTNAKFNVNFTSKSGSIYGQLINEEYGIFFFLLVCIIFL